MLKFMFQGLFSWMLRLFLKRIQGSYSAACSLFLFVFPWLFFLLALLLLPFAYIFRFSIRVITRSTFDALSKDQQGYYLFRLSLCLEDYTFIQQLKGCLIYPFVLIANHWLVMGLLDEFICPGSGFLTARWFARKHNKYASCMVVLSANREYRDYIPKYIDVVDGEWG